MKANLAILGGLFLSCDVKSFTIFIIMFTHLLWLQTNWFVYRTFTHVWQNHPCDCIRWARTFFFIAWIKPFSLILMYFNIDHNCFVNQLYHKCRLFAKKEQLAKKKQGDFNFVLASSGGLHFNFSWYRARISPSSSGLVSPGLSLLCP